MGSATVEAVMSSEGVTIDDYESTQSSIFIESPLHGEILQTLSGVPQVGKPSPQLDRCFCEKLNHRSFVKTDIYSFLIIIGSLFEQVVADQFEASLACKEVTLSQVQTVLKQPLRQ